MIDQETLDAIAEAVKSKRFYRRPGPNGVGGWVTIGMDTNRERVAITRPEVDDEVVYWIGIQEWKTLRPGETPETITQWAVDTFGNPPPIAVATRMNCEVAELLVGLANLSPEEVAEGSPRVTALQQECADVYIMLAQIAETLQIELQAVVDYKMGVNRRRNWARTDTGRFQHV
jgi:hypothetical protein